MYERSHVGVKVEPRSTSRLISTLYISPLFYLRTLTCVAKNASVEINLQLRNAPSYMEFANLEFQYLELRQGHSNPSR